ncbi:serine acetyltransferase [Variibacter gotjawalensis]|uniref:Serine acetyltransferase n=1 Tax=Variibacter gotjawalensis TaxID=1333996 RepID=A0A0S3PRA0_9BRAD|nr:serine acetyltransferase [Variibacter gotjawalensis]NIK48620.1 serine O-acetyltransferase [Variibacter gotjawalensis]RZS50484.1 serine O-acetyltransferase [Variibacter gotjawalensis]BAT58318.1 serine acetyltransferase [Variibacter gotjawalensis]
MSASSIWADVVAEQRLVNLGNKHLGSCERLADALTTLIAERLAACELEIAFRDAARHAFCAEPTLVEAAALDLLATRQSDPARPSLTQILYEYKGFLALQAWRVSNWLWSNRRRNLALLLQDATSRVLQISIHPSATIGTSVFLDHGTGIVIGPSASIGDNVTILQGVTIGRRYENPEKAPHVGRGVFLGAEATILGAVSVGDYAKIGAAALIEMDVPAGCTAVGNPAHLTNCPSSLATH